MQNPLENLTKEQLLALLEKETKRRAKAEKMASKKEQLILQKDQKISGQMFL